MRVWLVAEAGQLPGVVWQKKIPHQSLLGHLVASFEPVVSLDYQRLQSTVENLAVSLETPKKETSAQYVLDFLINELVTTLDDETFLILDDYHLVDQHAYLRVLIERLIAIQPGNLHILLSTRYEPALASLSVGRARGEVNQIVQADLAFTIEDTQALFDLYECPASIDDVAELTAACRGWPLALQALAVDQATAQESRDVVLGESAVYADNDRSPDRPAEHAIQSVFLSSSLLLLDHLTPLLDTYLGQQVFDDQSSSVQQLLLYTSRLRWIDKEACAVLPQLAPLQPLHAEVERRCLFLELTHTGHIAYQPLFKAFLERRAVTALPDQRDFHLRAAEYYRTQGDPEGVIHHLLAVGESEPATEVLRQVTRDWLQQGKAAALLAWLDRLPEAQRHQPEMLEAFAAASHRLGQFEQALHVYQQAEQAFQERNDQKGYIRALRGRAEIYLDTVQPVLAEKLLDKVLALLPQDHYADRAEILRLQAENWANRGRADVALDLETTASELAQRVSAPSWSSMMRASLWFSQTHGFPSPVRHRLFRRACSCAAVA